MKNWIKCSCGARVPVDHDSYGTGFCGIIPDSCEPCWRAAEERAERQEWTAFLSDDDLGPTV